MNKHLIITNDNNSVVVYLEGIFDIKSKILVDSKFSIILQKNRPMFIKINNEEGKLADIKYFPFEKHEEKIIYNSILNKDELIDNIPLNYKPLMDKCVIEISKATERIAHIIEELGKSMIIEVGDYEVIIRRKNV